MRRFAYEESDSPEPIILTEEQIISDYWVYWMNQMKAIGANEHSITRENCLEDWCIINWAWEIEQDEQC